MQFSKCRLTLDVVSVFSLVQDFNTFIYERLLSTVDANVARVALSQTYFGWWRRFRPNVAAVSGRRSRPTFEHLEVMYFEFVQQPSELSVGAVVSACTFPRPSVVADYNQFTQEVEHRSRKV